MCRYSHEETLWLECKRKKKDVVHKNRTAVPELEVVERLCGEPSLERSTWCGDWFLKRVAERSLRPAVQVHYRRFARTSTLDGENLRLTIDSHLQASPVSDWDESLVSRHSHGELRRDVSAVQILELKFHNHMPWLFKELLKEFAIPANGFSKFRSAVKCCQLVDVPEQSPGDSPASPLSQSRWDCKAGPGVDMADETACSYALGERSSDV